MSLLETSNKSCIQLMILFAGALATTMLYSSDMIDFPALAFSVQPALPRWERLTQFLDNVDEYRAIDDIDPLGRSAFKPHSVIRGNSPKLADGTRPKTVLVFNTMWEWGTRTALDRCPMPCILTTNRSQMTTADAVIIYAARLKEDPPERPPGQVWLFFTMESPIHSRIKTFTHPNWHNQINWTMTYRSESDVWLPYGRVNRRNKPLSRTFTTLATKKTKQVAWFVSNCVTPSKREKLVAELGKYLEVDVFGKCGTKTCRRNNRDSCFQMLTSEYKFYLSFENSLCDDYITEKIFGIMLNADIVPIVYGGANYSKFLPPHSYIDVADFTSVEALATHLKYLEKNVTAYAEYLEWKNYYFVSEWPNVICEICMKLNNVEKYRNVYKDVYSWFSNGTCHPPNLSLLSPWKKHISN